MSWPLINIFKIINWYDCTSLPTNWENIWKIKSLMLGLDDIITIAIAVHTYLPTMSFFE